LITKSLNSICGGEGVTLSVVVCVEEKEEKEKEEEEEVCSSVLTSSY
jgi:triosephosphate isomerase